MVASRMTGQVTYGATGAACAVHCCRRANVRRTPMKGAPMAVESNAPPHVSRRTVHTARATRTAHAHALGTAPPSVRGYPVATRGATGAHRTNSELTMKVIVSHRGKKHQLDELAHDACVRDVRDATAAVLNTDAARVRLLHRGRELRESDARLSDLKAPLTFLALLSDVQHAIKAPSYTLPVAAPRASSTRAGSSSSSDVRIGSIQVLEHLNNAHVARRMLEELANDEGFLFCMRQKGWRVNVLKEMLPDGRVGVDPVCVLGFNRGRGLEISLRLRTDDMRGFRDMYRVREVFAHELAHCERDQHDDAFKEIMRWVLRTADARSWNVGGRRVDDGRSGGFGGGGGEANRLGALRGEGAGSERLGGSASSSRLLREMEEQQRRRRHHK